MFTISTLSVVWLRNRRTGEKFWSKAPPKAGGFRLGQRDITHWTILLNTRPWDGQGSKPLLKITHRCQAVFLGPGRGLSYWLSLFFYCFTGFLWFLLLFSPRVWCQCGQNWVELFSSVWGHIVHWWPSEPREECKGMSRENTVFHHTSHNSWILLLFQGKACHFGLK